MFDMKHGFAGHKGIENFDLETDMKDPAKAQVILRAVDEKVRMLSAILREGQAKEDFEKMQVLLNGYLALQKVLTRINRRFV
ncbi:MAG: DUF5398 family protein [Victivallaceae bacterium]